MNPEKFRADLLAASSLAMQTASEVPQGEATLFLTLAQRLLDYSRKPTPQAAAPRVVHMPAQPFTHSRQ